MRSFLYAATVLALFAAGLANVMHETGGLRLVSAARASLGASAPLRGMIERALCEESAAAPKKKWVTAWTASAQGPYPSGFALLQPDLSLAFPDPGRGADDQSFRMIVRPDLWGGEARIRLSNAFGLKPVRFDRVYIGLHFESSAVAAGSNRPVTFGGKDWVEIPPGQDAWSDAAALPFVPEDDAASFLGRKLAISFHVAGESGPMTWHAKALTTSYLTAPHAGVVGAREDEAAFPFSTTSAFFLDALDMRASAGTKLVRPLATLYRRHGRKLERRGPLARRAVAPAA